MKEPHVILRLRPGKAGADGARAAARRTRATGIESPPAEKIEVQVDDLGDRDIATLRGDREVRAIAPIVPMKLIRPVSKGNSLSPPGGGDRIAWGVKAVKADQSDFTGEGVTVAILDTGIDSAHPAFAGVELTTRNFTDDENPADEDGHGTHCAGTVFGRDVGGVRIGIARGVSHALIGKVLGNQGGASDRIASAIQWALDHEATVISMSLGIDFPGLVNRWEKLHGMPTELAVSRALEGYRANVLLFERLASFVRALDAFGRPAIILGAAGNESRREKNKGFVIGVSPPAVSEGVLSVAAVGEGASGLDVADFSNVGADVAGPGVDIESAAAGSKDLVSSSGTSMATPHVAGVAALWAQQLRKSGKLSSARLAERVLDSATLLGLKSDLSPVDVGRGLVQAP